MGPEEGNALKAAEEERKEALSMVQFFKTLWDEVDLQFQGFEREEKIQIFSSILRAGEDRHSRIEELLRLAGEKGSSKKRRRP
jgi:transcription initiation factor TFIIIB Brf1 subunit/transcription initiation factor TFIIB